MRLHVQQSFAREDATLKYRFLPQLLAAVLFTAVATPALAQPPAPRAGHAITDLRAARDILSRGGPHGVSPDDQQAIALIDKVIAASVRVVQYDRARMHIEPQTSADTTASASSPHENARLFMTAALRDLDEREADPSARPYLDQARQQLTEALGIIQREEAAHRH
jgi:hypothetical protein